MRGLALSYALADRPAGGKREEGLRETEHDLRGNDPRSVAPCSTHSRRGGDLDVESYEGETMKRASERTRAAAVAAALVAVMVACGDDEPSGPFSSFEAAANDPTIFTEPRDAVPLDNGAI